MTRRRKIVLYTAAGLATAALMAAFAGVMALRSAWFRQRVRARIVGEVEQASGGKAELGSLRFDWRTMTARVSRFRLHGTEPPGEQPLFSAENLEIGLRIVSALKRDIDLASIRLERPSVNVLVDEGGNTNIPAPKLRPRRDTTALEGILALKIGRVELAGGSFRLGDREVPLDLSAENLKAEMRYDRAGSRYTGTLSAARFAAKAPLIREAAPAVEAAFSLEKNRIVADRLGVRTRYSAADVAGSLEDLKNPHLEIRGKASLAARDIADIFRIPIGRSGSASAQGLFRWNAAQGYSFDGNVTGSGITASRGIWRLSNARFRSRVHLAPALLELKQFDLDAEEAGFKGAATLRDWRDFTLDGELARVEIAELARLLQEPGIVWQGVVSGPVNARGAVSEDGVAGLVASGRLEIARTEGNRPVDGHLEFEFDQNHRSLSFKDSHIALPATRFELDGHLGERVAVSLDTSDLRDLEPMLRLAGAGTETPLPYALKNGAASFRGTVSGDLSAPHITGHVAATNVEVEERLIDRLAADVVLESDRLSFRNLAVRQGQMDLAGHGRVALHDWSATGQSALDASFTLRNVNIGALVKEYGLSAPVDGSAALTATLKGTVQAPAAEARVEVQHPSFGGEQFDRFAGEVRLSRESVELISGTLSLGESSIQAEGSYGHPPQDWESGSIRFNVASPALSFASLKWLAEAIPELRGAASLRARGTARVEKGEFLLTSLDGAIVCRDLALGKKLLGSVTAEATSNGQQLEAHATMQVPGSKLSGEVRMEMAGDYLLKGQVRLEPLSLTTIQNLLDDEPKGEEHALSGFLEASASFSGPARRPEKITGEGTISRLELKPRAVPQAGAKQPPVDLTVRNNGPIRLAYQDRAFRIQEARFVAQETNLAVDGSFSPTAKSPWDLRLRGDLNLAILESFSSEIRVSGVSLMDATLRGSFAEPALAGKLELKNASLTIPDVPNGIDNANGLLVFDRNKILIQEIKAQSGGGELSLSGLVGLGGKELAYRLHTKVSNVRVRYPEGVSTTLDADLNFSGTLHRSMLSGTATVVRSGVNERIDFGGLLAASAKPVATATTSSEFLQGLQLDVTVLTAPNFQFLTSYTKNLQTIARLQLRGTAAKPSVLGRINVSEGDIDFFGSRYTVTRGEIDFYNPSTIEPVLDADLETRVRGFSVNIRITGTPNRLNVSYRSDPPLSSSEILALLTVGRSPDVAQLTGSAMATTADAGTSTGGALLGQVLSTSVSGRLQKFFGVSRVKIDPRAIGLEGTPQAQLTVEQQISRDVTLTYVTNLQNNQQQIVRVEWNVNKRWSAVAVRDANGLFGVDFYYKKRLK